MCIYIKQIGGDLAAHIRAGVHRVQGAIPLRARHMRPHLRRIPMPCKNAPATSGNLSAAKREIPLMGALPRMPR